MNFKIILFFITTLSFSQEMNRNEYLLFGKIANKYEIEMYLKIDKNELSGYYSYLSKINSRLNLKGKLYEKTKIIIEETDNLGKKTGEFRGIIDFSKMSIVGYWCKSPSFKKYDFFLQQKDIVIKKSDYVGISDKKIQKEKSENQIFMQVLFVIIFILLMALISFYLSKNKLKNKLNDKIGFQNVRLLKSERAQKEIELSFDKSIKKQIILEKENKKLKNELKEIKKQKKSFLKSIELEPKNNIEFYDGSNTNKLPFKRINYAFTIAANIISYPILKIPMKGCIVKSHKYGKNKRRGYKERSFQKSIEAYFSNEYEISGNVILITGEYTNPYEPDIAIIGKNNNIRIDVEIDEPYAGITRQATHCLRDDDCRNNYFTDRGWIVIRFSEYQVHSNEIACIQYIASIINSIDKSFILPSNFIKENRVESENLWDLVLAQKWEKENYRENYLNHTFSIDQKLNTTDVILSKKEKLKEVEEENEVNSTTYGNVDEVVVERFNKKNINIRDSKLIFYPKSHIYSIENKHVPSVSTVIKRFFNEFDMVKAATNLSPLNPLYELPISERIRVWEDKGIISRDKGTYLHQQIENYYLGKPFDNTDVFYQFLSFANDHGNLNVYRSEWRIFDEKYDIAGTIDLLVKNEDGSFDIYDWKRSKKITNNIGVINNKNYGKFGIGELRHLKDISYNHYSLQQNLYRYILEEKYNLTIKNMFLIVMSDVEDFNDYVKVPVQRMQDEVIYILKTLRN